MLITKSKLKAIIKEEAISAAVVREAKMLQTVNEGFMQDMAKKFNVSKTVVAAIVAAAVSAGHIPRSAACPDEGASWDCFAHSEYGAECDQVSPDYAGGITHNMVLKIEDGKYVANIINAHTKEELRYSAISLEELSGEINKDAPTWWSIKVVAKIVNGKKQPADVKMDKPPKVDLSVIR